LAQPSLPKTKHWRFEIDAERLGWLTIDTPKSSVNTLSRETIAELEKLVARFEELVATSELVGVILLSGKESGFIAGADISEFDAMADFAILPEALRRTHELFTRIEKLKVPVVAEPCVSPLTKPVAVKVSAGLGLPTVFVLLSALIVRGARVIERVPAA